MSNILEILATEDLNFLQELADDVEGTLLTLTCGDGLNIKKAQEQLCKKYGQKVENFRRDIETFGTSSGITKAIDNIVCAYHVLQELDPENPDLEEAYDAIYEFLIWPEPYNLEIDSEHPSLERAEACDQIYKS